MRTFSVAKASGLVALLVTAVMTEAQTALSDTQWSSLGSGMNERVYALAVVGTNLYAGGLFTQAGGEPANRVARWNGQGWSALGSGISGGTFTSVYALAASGNDLYVGGCFTTAGGSPATNLAKWDGNAWSSPGSALGGYDPCVYALAVRDNVLYAGGRFESVNGVWVLNVARYSEGTWSPLAASHPADGAGVNGTVYALLAEGDGVMAGGSFTSAAGVPSAPGLAKWTGTWSAVGGGLNGSVWTLARSGADLYAGGGFNAAGGSGNRLSNIARWNGAGWSSLTYWGVNGTVRCLAVAGTNLYAGGDFTQAGDAPANHIAIWTGAYPWLRMGSGVGSGSPFALATNEAGVLFVGGDFTMAGTNAAAYIAQADLRPPNVGGRFDNLSYSPGSGFRCTFSGATPGRPWRIQVRPALGAGAWIDLTNFTYTGPILITDGPAEAGSARFYRATSP